MTNDKIVLNLIKQDIISFAVFPEKCAQVRDIFFFGACINIKDIWIFLADIDYL